VNVLNNSREQSTRGGPPAWEMGKTLKTPHCKAHMRDMRNTYKIFIGRTAGKDRSE
jgi:hypothetical protein